MAGRKSHYPTHFGEALRTHLDARRMTSSALAAAVDKEVAYVSQVMTGIRTPSASYADLVASVLNLDPAQRAALHKAAAMDHGFKLDLTKPD